MAQPGQEVRRKTWGKPGLQAGHARVTSLDPDTSSAKKATHGPCPLPTSTGKSFERGHADPVGTRTTSREASWPDGGDTDKMGQKGDEQDMD